MKKKTWQQAMGKLQAIETLLFFVILTLLNEQKP
jgi:hypothetical protein